MDLPHLTGDRLVLRPLDDEDLADLVAAIAAPSVAAWWGDISDEANVAEGLVNEGAAFAIEVDGTLAGWLGVCEENEPDYRHVALDIMLAEPFHGRGLGREALRVAIRWLIDERGHHRITIDPSMANERAIRAYAAVGFRPVGVLRASERAPDGRWRDGLLMDLLADELIEADDDGSA